MVDVKAYIASLGNPAKITMLKLSNKNITHLNEDTFENLTQLETLSLCVNQLTILPPKIFENLTQLKKLWLWGNKLTSLPPTLFKNLTQLEQLSLCVNQVTTLPPKIFENLTQLKKLWLFGNQLTNLPLVNEKCFIEVKGREEIEQRRKDKEEHWNKWKYVGATLESLPPTPSNYAHLPVFTETFLGKVGGVDWVRGLEELEELNNELEGIN